MQDDDDDDTCQVCDGDGVAYASCPRCRGAPPQYCCRTCGDCGEIEIPCPECTDEEPEQGEE